MSTCKGIRHDPDRKPLGGYNPILGYNPPVRILPGRPVPVPVRIVPDLPRAGRGAWSARRADTIGPYESSLSILVRILSIDACRPKAPVTNESAPNQAGNSLAGAKKRGQIPTMVICAILCSLPSVFLLLAVPPIFNNSDSYEIFLRALPILVPHSPPIYPVFVRSFAVLWGFSPPTIYAILIAQHILSIVGMLSIVSLFEGRARRIAGSVFMLAANYFCVLSQGLFSESLALSLLMLYLACGTRVMLLEGVYAARMRLRLFFSFAPNLRLRLRLNARTTWTILSLLALYLVSESRHAMLAFAVLLPVFYLLNSLVQPGERLLNLKLFLVNSLLVIFVLGGIHCTNVFLGRVLGANTDFILGRASVYRMHTLPWATMKPAEKAGLIATMQSHNVDPFVKAAIPIMIEDENPWPGSLAKLEALSPKFGGENPDKVMNQAAIAFYMTPNVYLFQDILKACDYYFSNRDHCFSKLIELGKFSINWFRTSPCHPAVVSTMPMIQNIQLKDYDRINWIVKRRVFDEICNYYLLAALALVICTVRVALGRAPRALIPLVVATGFSGVAYILLTAMVTVTLPRYVTPLHCAIWAMLAFAGLINKKEFVHADTKRD
jgi:hypothetical protein